MDLKEHLQTINDSPSGGSHSGQPRPVNELLATLGALATLFVVTVCVKTIADPKFIGGMAKGMSGQGMDKDSSAFKGIKSKLKGAKDYMKQFGEDIDKLKGKDYEEAEQKVEDDASTVSCSLAIADMAEESISKEDDPQKKSKAMKLLGAFRSSTTDDNGNLIPPGSWRDRWSATTGFDVDDTNNVIDLDLDEDGVYKQKDTLMDGLSGWFDKKGDKGMNEEVEKNSFLAQTFAPKMKMLMAHNDKPEEDIIEMDSLKEEASAKRSWLAKINSAEDADLKADLEKDMDADIKKIQKKKEGLISKLLKAASDGDEEGVKDVADKTGLSMDKDDGPDWEEGEGKEEKVDGIMRRIFKGKFGGRYYKTKKGDKVYVESVDLGNYLRESLQS